MDLFWSVKGSAFLSLRPKAPSPDGIELTVLTDMTSDVRHWRMIRNQEFDVAELSMSNYRLLILDGRTVLVKEIESKVEWPSREAAEAYGQELARASVTASFAVTADPIVFVWFHLNHAHLSPVSTSAKSRSAYFWSISSNFASYSTIIRATTRFSTYTYHLVE